MKTLFLLMAVMMVMSVSCSKRVGTTRGVLVDAANQGTFIMSCELDIQYGKESSRIEHFSSRDLGLCTDLAEKTGSDVKISYHYENFSLSTDTGDIIDRIEFLE